MDVGKGIVLESHSLESWGVKEDRSPRGECFFLRRKLGNLRVLLRGYLALQLAAWFLIAVTVLFWITYWVDRGWGVPVGARKFLAIVLTGGVTAWGLWSWGRSIFRRLRLPQLALLLERVNPHLDGLLVTAAELVNDLSDGSGKVNPYRQAFVRQTLNEAENRIVELPVAGVVRFGPLIRQTLAAALCVGVVILYMLYAPDEVSVWAARWLRLEDRPWPLRTGIVLEGFYDGKLVVPKGQPVEIAAAVDLSMPWVPRVLKLRLEDPSGLRRELWMFREGVVADGPFQRHVARLSELFDVTTVSLAAGDFRLSGLAIIPRDPPAIRRLEARCRFPDYLRRSEEILSSASLLKVPEGTHVQIRITPSRPVIIVRVGVNENIHEYCPPEWREVHKLGQEIEAIFREFLRNGQWEDLTTRLGKVFQQLEHGFTDLSRVAEVLGKRGTNADSKRGKSDRRLSTAHLENPSDPTSPASLVYPAKSLVLKLQEELGRPPGSEPIPAWQLGQQFRELLKTWESLRRQIGGSLAYEEFSYDLDPVFKPQELRIWLTDVDGIGTIHPIPISVTPLRDQPPKLNVELQGVGPAVTPEARLHFVGDVEDDHGLARIEVLLATVGEGTGGPGEGVPTLLVEFPNPVAQHSLDSLVDLAPLGLSPGTKLRLQLRAFDWCNLRDQPNKGESPSWSLDVVTPEQLRLLLEKREILLRQQLDQIITELQELHRFLQETAGNMVTLSENLVPENLEAQDSKIPGDQQSAKAEAGQGRQSKPPSQFPGSFVKRAVSRAEEQISKSDHELRAVRSGIRQICQELVQNRLDAPSWLERLRLRVEPPLTEVLDRHFPEMTALLSPARELLEAGESGIPPDAPAWLETLVSSLSETIRLLSAARDAMLELEDIRRVAEILRQIIQAQEETLEATREEHRRKLREILQGRP